MIELTRRVARAETVLTRAEDRYDRACLKPKMMAPDDWVCERSWDGPKWVDDVSMASELPICFTTTPSSRFGPQFEGRWQCYRRQVKL